MAPVDPAFRAEVTLTRGELKALRNALDATVKHERHRGQALAIFGSTQGVEAAWRAYDKIVRAMP